MTRALNLQSLSIRPFAFALVGLCVSLGLFCTVSIQQAHAEGLTSAQAEAIVGVLRSFGTDQTAINTVAGDLNTAVAMGSGSTNLADGAPVGSDASQVNVIRPTFAPVPPVLAATQIKPPVPACTLTASPTSVTAGQQVVLSWASTNAISASMPGGITSGSPNGSLMRQPMVTTTYQKTVYGPGGQATCEVTVTVVNTTAASSSVQASTIKPPVVVAALGALDLIDNTFGPEDLAQAAAAVLSAPFQILTDGFTDYFVSIGVN